MPRDAKEPTLATRPVDLSGTRAYPRTPIYERAYIYEGERLGHGGYVRCLNKPNLEVEIDENLVTYSEEKTKLMTSR